MTDTALYTQRLREFSSAADCLGPQLARALSHLGPNLRIPAREIRLRVGYPIQIDLGGRIFSMDHCQHPDCIILTKPVSIPMLQEVLQALCEDSVHSHQAQLCEGYLSLRGGHRAGIAGTCVFAPDGTIQSVRNITSISLRISREFPGTADRIFPLVKASSGGLLLFGEPACGKTTILRDLCRRLSYGLMEKGGAVAVLDERGELAGADGNGFAHDLGPCSDVLSGFPKAEGMEFAIRTLSPRFLICDEIGSEREAAAVEPLAGAGVRLIASAHGATLEDLYRRRGMAALLDNGVFDTLVLLAGRDGVGKIGQIWKRGSNHAAADGRRDVRTLLYDGGISCGEAEAGAGAAAFRLCADGRGDAGFAGLSGHAGAGADGHSLQSAAAAGPWILDPDKGIP